MDFISALMNPDIAFLRYALIAGVLASFSLGVIGTFVVARRISYIAGAISHTVLGGIGIALYLQKGLGWEWFHPMYGAVLSALLSAGLIGWVSLHAKEREDTVIGALWAVGMAVGILFIAKTPGYVDPMSFLFGNILLIGQTDLYLIALMDIVVVGCAVYFYNYLLAVSFDDEFAKLRGVKVEWVFLLLLMLTALTVVLLVRVVGIVMVIALLTLPAAVAGQFSRKLWQMMIGAVIASLLFVVSGLGISYSLDLPTGPVIIMIAGVVYFISVITKRKSGKRGN